MTTTERRLDPVVGATSAVLGAAAVLHAVWGLPITIPGVDRDRMAEAVGGAGDLPGPLACFAVAGALGSAAGLVAGRPTTRPRLVRAGRWGVALAVGARGVLGLVGRTDLVAPGAVTERFRRGDRRVYTPLYLALSAGALRALALDRRP